MATIAICEFILEEMDNITITRLCALCMILNKTYIDTESEDKDVLKQPKRRAGDLYDTIEDSTASRLVEPLLVLLDDVIDDENVQDEFAKKLALDDFVI